MPYGMTFWLWMQLCAYTAILQQIVGNSSYWSNDFACRSGHICIMQIGKIEQTCIRSYMYMYNVDAKLVQLHIYMGQKLNVTQHKNWTYVRMLGHKLNIHTSQLHIKCYGIILVACSQAHAGVLDNSLIKFLSLMTLSKPSISVAVGVKFIPAMQG